ncbi:MAG: hypothetical protein ABH864_00225 [archaeon]
MKNWGLLLLVGILLCSLVAAETGFEVEEIDEGSVVIVDIGNPAHYDLIINNLGKEEEFRVFTLVGVMIEPTEYFVLPPGKTTVPITAYMGEKILSERRGLLSFEYQIKGRTRDLFKDKLLVKLVSLDEILDIEYEPVHPDNTFAKISVSNKENVRIQNLTIIAESVFFRESFVVDLGPYENETFTIMLNKEGTGNLMAGPYLVSAKVVTGDEEKEFEGFVDFLEKEGTSVADSTEGIIVRKTTVRKINRGNTQVVANVSLRRDVFSRLFTTHTDEPDGTNRDGFFVEYVWTRSLSPGEDLTVRSTTNYTFPFIALLVIIAIGVLVRMFYWRAVLVKKKTTLVRTKGGEFALRVVLRVRARKTVNKLQLIDRLPAMTKLYDQFGKKPDKIDKETRRLVWNVGHLGRGQERVYSYVIYSKLNVVGRFELPRASALYEMDGEPGESYSNVAFFAAEKD